MDLQVSGVPGMRDCFAALPLEAIYALQGQGQTETFAATLELRLSNGDSGQGPWYLAWAGAASTSSSIEISKRLEDSLRIPHGVRFHVKALKDISHAKTVELEPATEDDWEILELNAGFVEDHILSQVGVLCSGQQFPIWVEGGNVLTLHVISTEPKRVVRLVPGTELVVAPKVRKISSPGPKVLASKMESSVAKAWLRVQELHPSLMQWLDGVSCSIAPTTAVFVSEETAKNHSFNNGHLIALTSVQGLSKQQEELQKENSRKTDGTMAVKASKATTVVVCMVYCDLVAPEHAMLASSICHSIGAPVHSRIELKSYIEGSKISECAAIISPIRLKSVERSLSDAPSSIEQETRDGLPTMSHEQTVLECDKHKNILRTLSHQVDQKVQTKCNQEDFEKEKPSYDFKHKEVENLFKVWVAAQVTAISKYVPEQRSTIPVMVETVIQLEQEQTASNVALPPQNGSNMVTLNKHVGCQIKRYTETILFLISLHNLKDNSEKTANSETETVKFASTSGSNLLLLDIKPIETKNYDMMESISRAGLRIIKVGQPRHIATSLKNVFEDEKGPSLGSLTWLKEPASEVLIRLQVSLSPEGQAKCHKAGLPSPGYVLLHGPPACGKTKLALAIARELEESPLLLTHKVIVKGAELVGEQAQAVRGAIQCSRLSSFAISQDSGDSLQLTVCLVGGARWNTTSRRPWSTVTSRRPWTLASSSPTAMSPCHVAPWARDTLGILGTRRREGPLDYGASLDRGPLQLWRHLHERLSSIH